MQSFAMARQSARRLFKPAAPRIGAACIAEHTATAKSRVLRLRWSCPRCAETSASAGALDRASKLDGIPAIADYEEAGGMLAINARSRPENTSCHGRTAIARQAGCCNLSEKHHRRKNIADCASAENVAAGFRTGIGGVAVMEVSDPSGRDWAGTAIHENLDAGTNTCQPGTPGCSNAQGQAPLAAPSSSVPR